MGSSNRSYSREIGVLEKDVINLSADIAIGASGAVSSAKGGGLVSVSKLATAGQYSVVLDSGFQKLLALQATPIGASASGVASVQILMTPAALLSAIKAGTGITIQCYDNSGAAVNPASGTTLKLSVSVRRSVVGPWD